MKIKKFILMLCLVGLICPVYVNNMVRANADFFEALKKVTPNATSEERQIILQMLSSVQKAMGAEGNVIDLCSKYTTKK